MKYYYYLFYKFYKFGQLGTHPIFSAETIAFIVICSMEFMIQISIFTYSGLFFGWDFDASSIEFVGPAIAIFVFNAICFWFKNKWKTDVAEFEKWPVKKNNKGSWIVIGMLTFVVASFACAIYLTPVSNGAK